MDKELYERWDFVCSYIAKHLERFEKESLAENKAMLFEDIERLAPLADDNNGPRDPVAFRQLRCRMPEDASSICSCLYSGLDWGNPLEDDLKDYPMAQKVLRDLLYKAGVVIQGVEAANMMWYEGKPSMLSTVP
ncbi:MAG: hypothetical protein KHX35_05775 [Sutterella wadsworthensis]|nr:hypothetical protein [Sutterella wadsworthensis]